MQSGVPAAPASLSWQVSFAPALYPDLRAQTVEGRPLKSEKVQGTVTSLVYTLLFSHLQNR